jgi:protoporphyrinogen oxidase
MAVNDRQKRVVILGGGVCGLYAARVLSGRGMPVTVVEKEEVFGGLALSRQYGNNFYDQGVHMLHAYDKEIFEDCKEMMGRERVEVNLDARIRWAEGYYRYPLQFGDMIRGMNTLTLGQCVLGLFFAQFRNLVAPWDPRDCEEALIQLYGRPLYEFFFKEFTTRYWGMPPTMMSAQFVRRKMPRLTAVDAIKKVLAMVGIKEKPGRSVESALLEETLHYSRTGAETLPRAIATRIARDGGILYPSHLPEAVVVEGGKVRAVRCRNIATQGDLFDIPCDYCISTIPLPSIVSKLEPSAPPDIVEAAAQLRHLPIVIYGLLVRKERALDCLYVYYRERIFHRVGEPKNAGLRVDPPDHTVLIVEMTCQEGDAKWNGEESAKEELFADLEAEGVCRREEIEEIHILRNTHGYPVFDYGYEPSHAKIVGHLATIANLESTGRQGGFCFPNMHSAMRMGADAAEKAIAYLTENAQPKA